MEIKFWDTNRKCCWKGGLVGGTQDCAGLRWGIKSIKHNLGRKGTGEKGKARQWSRNKNVKTW